MEYVLGMCMRHPFCTSDKMGKVAGFGFGWRVREVTGDRSEGGDMRSESIMFE